MYCRTCKVEYRYAGSVCPACRTPFPVTFLDDAPERTPRPAGADEPWRPRALPLMAGFAIGTGVFGAFWIALDKPWPYPVLAAVPLALAGTWGVWRLMK